MANFPKISVIVPFYNLEEKLFMGCIRSILNQTFTDFELIVINDGSEKKYETMLNDVAAMDSRISVFNELNGGASIARNVGVKYSKGDYIAFVDSDDIVHKQYLEQAYDIMVKEKVDFVVGSIIDMPSCNAKNAQKLSQERVCNNKYSIYEHRDIVALIPRFISTNQMIRFANGGHVNRGPVAKLLKKEIAEQVEFPQGVVIGEDLVWNQYVLKKCNRIAVAENIWYYYLKRSDSSVYRFKTNSVEIVQKACLVLYDSIKDSMNDDIYRAFCTRLLDQTRQTICLANLTNRANKDFFWKKQRAFMALKKEYPWKYITWRYAKVGNRREKTIFFLYWSNLYFLVAYIKDKCCR